MILLLPEAVGQEPCSSDLEAPYANLKGLESIDVSRFFLEFLLIVDAANHCHFIEKSGELGLLGLLKTVDELLGGTLTISQHNVFHCAPITTLGKSSFGPYSHLSLALSKQIWKPSAREKIEP